MKRLYFIRHGESEFNRANKWSGSSDTPLTEQGHKQAKQAGRKLREQNIPIDIIISSPLERAHQTAKHVANEINYPHEKILLQEQLTERNFGMLEGRKDLVAATRYISSEAAIDSYRDVEKIVDLHDRALAVLEYLKSLDHDTVLIVGHGAFGRALRRAINDEPLHVRGKAFQNAEIVRLI